MEGLHPFFLCGKGWQRVDDCRVSSGITFFSRDGLGCHEAARDCEPTKARCNRWKPLSKLSVILRIINRLRSNLRWST